MRPQTSTLWFCAALGALLLALAAAYAALGLATDDLGFALDPTATVPLDTLMAAMIRVSDNAAPDLLLARLGLAPFQAALAELGPETADLPLSFLGGVLARYNFETGSLTPRRLRALTRLRPTARRAYYDALAARFAHDAVWREQQIAWYLGPDLTLDYALERSAVEQLTASGTAGAYAQLMAGVVTGTLLTPEAHAVMRRHLELPLAPGAPFESVGIKGGTLAGVLNDATWAIPAVGDFAGQRRITVMFLSGLPEATWYSLQETFVHQELLFLLAFDRATAQATEVALRGRRGRR